MPGLTHPPTTKAFSAGLVMHRTAAPAVRRPSRLRRLAAAPVRWLRRWLLRLAEVGF